MDFTKYMVFDNLLYEKELNNLGYKAICGIDEAGRGPMAGPVVAAAVILPFNVKIEEVTDSKKLTAAKREYLFDIIKEVAISFGVGIVSPEEIDRINILQATFKAMRRAVKHLKINPDYLIIDGRDTPFTDYSCKSIIKGDYKSQTIAAASIIAKVTRDRIMLKYAKIYPEFDFIHNKGYGTKKHLAAIREFGRSKIHRQSFKLKEEKVEQLILF